MNLMRWTSGYDGRVLLREQPDEERFDWTMESAGREKVVAYGEVFLPFDEAWPLLESLSLLLEESGYSHRLGLDDESGHHTRERDFRWSETTS
ncbi:MAG: hypothetical protein AAF533_16300 [Acidobacteriota bacterium]